MLPVAVQGEASAKEIRTMLALANASQAYDAILLTRGGGSLEDLWSFNDEALAREIAQSKTIVISAVGHEIDFSLSDFAADIRAACAQATLAQVARQAPQLRQCRLERVITEKRATFACTPGVVRPATSTPEAGLWLAGDYVASPYPATLEAAVRSGISAARGILKRCGLKESAFLLN